MVLPRDNLREAVDFLMHFLGSFIVGYSFPIFPKVESERVRRDRHGARGCLAGEAGKRDGVLWLLN
jgi:hypothetical protein